MADLVAERTELVILSCWCGIQHAVPKSLRTEQMRAHNNGESPRGIYCPLGHSHVPVGKSECERLHKSLHAEVARTDQLRASLRDTEASLSATKGVVTRMKNRVRHGVCPCCKRQFKNLERHMSTKHPGFGDAQARGAG